MFMTIGTAMAQVFIMDDDGGLNQRNRDGSITFNVMVNAQDVTHDQFIPLGEGVLLLSGMAGFYLLRKRKRN
jgi:LPXTG-motif cell wall-anchored protein